MNHIEEFKNAGLDAKTGVLLKDYLSLNIGGAAEYFINAKTIEDVTKAIDISKRLNLRYFQASNSFPDPL